MTTPFSIVPVRDSKLNFASPPSEVVHYDNGKVQLVAGMLAVAAAVKRSRTDMGGRKRGPGMNLDFFVWRDGNVV